MRGLLVEVEIYLILLKIVLILRRILGWGLLLAKEN